MAALFVERGGVYWNREGVDPWHEGRDARRYAGPWPVVAHPPCSRWCQLAHVNQKRYGHRVGDDGGCFEAALNAVQTWGGVLEHPAFSYAWPAFKLPRPINTEDWTGFERGHAGGKEWVCQVAQRAYGHRARKLTWLYYVGHEEPHGLNWTWAEPEAQVSYCKNHGNSPLPRLSKKEAKSTPRAFADELVALARKSRALAGVPGGG